MTQGYDYELGQQIGSLIARQGGASFAPAPLVGQVQDLLGEDTTLLGPLRDLLQRPGFRRLFSDGQRSVQISGREALLQDLSSLYHPSVVSRLSAVLDGCLGLPASTATAPPPPPPPQATPQTPYQAAPPYNPPPSGSAPSGWAPPYPQPQSAPPPPYGAPQSAPPQSPPPYGAPQPPYPPNPYPAPAPAGGTNPLTLALTVIASFLAGAVLLSLGWLLLNARPTPAPTASGGAQSNKGTSPLPPAPAPPPPAPAADSTPKGTSDNAVASGAWGSASEYKFGQLPGGDYPNSCAFSQTSSDGKITTDKSSLEYWACRDVGGNPETGYRVVWADGKETTYTFGPGGAGQVVGTNGSTYPMRWSNDSHKGEDIVVINHQDGAITWIPGNITPSGD